MKDAVGKNVKLKEEAIKWLNSESFETVCELANLGFQYIKKHCFDILERKK